MLQVLKLYASRARGVTPKKLASFLVPRRIDQLLYVISLRDHQSRECAKVPIEIRKACGKMVTTYSAVVSDKVVHRTDLSRNTILPAQFGFESFPVLGNSMTLPEYRGLGIYAHVLSHILDELKQDEPHSSVFMIVGPENHQSIRGIERAGFSFRARLHGIRIGPVVWRLGRDRVTRTDC